MDAPDPFGPAPNETHAEMMRATYDALRKHGYSELTVQRIGDEFSKSKSLIYQHYGSKDELLVALLEHLLEELEASVPTDAVDAPRERLLRIVDYALPESLEPEHADFMVALETLRGQAPHDDEYRDQFAEINAVHRAHVADVVRDGIEDGTFRDVDPERAAGFVVATIHGARNQRVTTGSHDPVLDARHELEAYVENRLAADGETR